MKWHDAFRLGSYEALSYFNHLSYLGTPSAVTSSQRMFSRCNPRTNPSPPSSITPSQIPQTVNASASLNESAALFQRTSQFTEITSSTSPSFLCLRHALRRSTHSSESDFPEVLSSSCWEFDILSSSSLMHSPAFRSAFAVRRRKLERRENGNHDDLLELAVLYRFQSQLDLQDRLVGASPPGPLSGSPDFSITNAASIAVFSRMDRSLVLGFSRAVDSAQLNIPNGKQLLHKLAKEDINHGDAVQLKRYCGDHFRLDDNRLPAFTSDDATKTVIAHMSNISEAAKKINWPTGTHPDLACPILMQRLALAPYLTPLHGNFQIGVLNCYEVSLLSVNVHAQITALTSDRNLSQTILSDPNLKTVDTSAESMKHCEFAETMLSIMHEHPKSSQDVRSFRYKFAIRRSLSVVWSYFIVVILVIALVMYEASGPQISGFVQYIRKEISTASITSLTPMSEFQSNVRQLAPLLWPRCQANPSYCGFSRLGSVRVTQWRHASLVGAPCFSSPSFSTSCLMSDSNTVTLPIAAMENVLKFNNGNATIGSDGRIVALLDSGSRDEALWDDFFRPESLFFAAETARVEVVATLFSPKLQHFVTFEVAALFDTGLAQNRCH
jgi:hypothetical protein